jgi:hypothetical protein
MLLLLLPLVLFQRVSAYSITLAKNSEECFFHIITSSSSLTGSFEVITGNPKALTVSVFDPTNYLHYESKLKSDPTEEVDLSEGSFSFSANKVGDYKMCFMQDTSIDSEPITVAFNYRVFGPRDHDYQYKGLDAELMDLKQGLDLLKDHQSFMSQREFVHKATLESINMKVIFWTAVEAIILIGMALWQTSYISNFFETKRKL